MNFRSAIPFAATAAALLAAAGCGSPCVQPGDSITLVLKGDADDLNNTGSGPQLVRYRAWAVADSEAFEAKFKAEGGAAKLVTDTDLQGPELGTWMGSASDEWLVPGAEQPLPFSVVPETTVTHVGVVVLFPKAQFKLVRLACKPAPGYGFRPKAREHHVQMDVGRDAIALPAKVATKVEE